MRRIAGAAVIAVITALSLVAVATAHTVRVDSSITFQVKKNGQDPDTFEGKVSSDRARCVANRLVEIYWVQDGEDIFVDDTLTDANGDYSTAPGDIQAGTYYAVVWPEVLVRNESHRHVCKRGISSERVVAGPVGQ